MTDLEKQKEFVNLIQAAYPGIDIRSARLETADGEYSDILILNEDLVFRFPRYAENIPGFLHEAGLLAKLQGRLPLPIPNPLYASTGSAEPGKVFMSYRLIPGRPLYPETLKSITNEAILQGLAKQLADFLSTLHLLAPNLTRLDLPLLDMPAWVRTFFNEVREHLFPTMRSEACLELTEYFENYFNTPDLQLYQPALIHGDFGGSNILIDNNKISGILDFSSTGYGDPALDLAAVSTYGEPFFTRICQFYVVTESQVRRAKFYRSMFALEEALHGWKNDDKVAFERGMEQYV